MVGAAGEDGDKRGQEPFSALSSVPDGHDLAYEPPDALSAVL